MNLLNSRIVRFLLGIWLPILLIWWWWTWSADSVDPFFPPLSAIWEQFMFNWIWQLFPIHVVPSLRNLFLGYLIGVFAGVTLGALLGASSRVSRYFEPVIDFLRSIPPVATVPVFILFFGLDVQMRVAAIAVAACFPTLLSTMQGFRATDTTLLDTGRVFGLTPFQMMWKVRVPNASPIIWSGLQVSLQIAFVVTIASEILGSGFGIGAFTVIASDSFLILDAWTGVILMGLLGFAINVIFDLVERWSLRWYIGQKKLAS
jgi:ABC-type nitrate/sulfonate/bicarbonate transport system permease component